MKKLLQKIIALVNNLNFLFLINGILLATLFHYIIESKYESELFIAINKNIKTGLPVNHTKETYLLKAMEMANQLQKQRYEVFGQQKLAGLKANFFRPPTFDLMTANGACGSYATVLARILKANDIPVRIGQMKVNETYGGHIFVEAKTENGWIVLDPMYNLVFKKQNGEPATFADLNKDWQTFKQQVPPDYNTAYNYSGVRYTNWEKIPGITTTIKSLLDAVIGKTKADQFSVRPYLLRTYHKLAWITAFVLFFIFLRTMSLYRRKKLFPTSGNTREIQSTSHAASTAA